MKNGRRKFFQNEWSKNTCSSLLSDGRYCSDFACCQIIKNSVKQLNPVDSDDNESEDDVKPVKKILKAPVKNNKSKK